MNSPSSAILGGVGLQNILFYFWRSFVTEDSATEIIGAIFHNRILYDLGRAILAINPPSVGISRVVPNDIVNYFGGRGLADNSTPSIAIGFNYQNPGPVLNGKSNYSRR